MTRDEGFRLDLQGPDPRSSLLTMPFREAPCSRVLGRYLQGKQRPRREKVGNYKTCTEKHIIQTTIHGSVLPRFSHVLEELPPSPETVITDLM